MFSKIVVAFDDLPESQRASCGRLTSHVPAMLNSQPCPSWGDLPAYTSFAIVATGNFTKVVQRVPITIVFSGTALSRSAVAGILASPHRSYRQRWRTVGRSSMTGSANTKGDRL